MTKIELFSIPIYLINEERYLKTLTDRMNNYVCKFSDDRKEEVKSVWKKYNYINKPWKYNQIIGYVEIVYRDNSIYFDIYKVFKITPSIQNSYQVLLYLIIVTVIIYVVCSIVEYIRQLIFKIVYNFKISQKIRNKYYGFLEKCKV